MFVSKMEKKYFITILVGIILISGVLALGLDKPIMKVITEDLISVEMKGFTMAAGGEIGAGNEKPQGFISDDVAKMRWEINNTGAEKEVFVYGDIINETTSKFCTTVLNRTKYEANLSLSARDIKQVPLEKVRSLNSDNFTLPKNTLDLSSSAKENCFYVQHDDLEGDMKFKIGWGSVLVSTDADPNVLFNPGENFVINSTGGYHVAFEDGGNDPRYCHSETKGATWACVQLAATSNAGISILINSTDDMYITYQDLTVSDQTIDMWHSIDSGATWVNLGAVMQVTGADLSEGKCVVNANDKLFCVANQNAWKVAYVNYTAGDPVGQSATIMSDGSDDSDWCDIAVNQSDCTMISCFGSDGDDIDLWGDCLNGWGSGNRITVHEGTQDRNPDITLGMDKTDENHPSLPYIFFFNLSSDNGFSNTTISNYGAWDTTAVGELGLATSGLTSGVPINTTVGVEIGAVYDGGAGSGIYTAISTDGGLTWDNYTVVLNNASHKPLYPKPAGSFYPYFARNLTARTVHFIWENDLADDIWYTNHTFAGGTPPADTCTCVTTGAWTVDCSDNCDITANCAMDGSGLFIVGAGYFEVDNANITNTGDIHVGGSCDVYLRNGGGIRRA